MASWSKRLAPVLTIGLLASLNAAPAAAVFTYYDDETLFNGAHSLPLTLESFEGFSSGDGEPIVAADFTLTTGDGSAEINQFFTGVYPTDGSNYVGWAYPNNASLIFDFDSPQSVFSMDITDLASVGAVTVDVFADGGLSAVVPTINEDNGFSHGGLNFIGLVSDSSFSSLRFEFAVSEWIGVDRVQYGASPVPLPAAVWLFGSALLGLIGFSRRRRSA